MNKNVYLLFLFAVSFCLYLFEQNTMFSDEITLGKNVSDTLIIGLLLIFTIPAVLMSNRPLLKNRLSRAFSYLMIYIIILSYIYTLQYPFGSQNMYGLIVVPLLLLYFSSSTSHYATSDSAIIWTMTVVVALLSFYYLNNYYNNINYDIEHVNNGSYSVLYLLPFILCHKKRIIVIAGIFLVLFIIMFSLKRGGLLALSAGIMMYILVSQLMRRKQHVNIYWLILSVLMIVGIIYLIVYINNKMISDMMFSRFENDETGGSYRMELYSDFLHKIINGPSDAWLFGYGWRGSVRIGSLGMACHNDFLEALVDFGIVGFILYILFMVALIKHTIQMIKARHEYAPAMVASLAIFLVNSNVSSILTTPKYLMEFSLFWGFIISATGFLSFKPQNR